MLSYVTDKSRIYAFHMLQVQAPVSPTFVVILVCRFVLVCYTIQKKLCPNEGVFHLICGKLWSYLLHKLLILGGYHLAGQLQNCRDLWLCYWKHTRLQHGPDHVLCRLQSSVVQNIDNRWVKWETCSRCSSVKNLNDLVSNNGDSVCTNSRFALVILCLNIIAQHTLWLLFLWGATRLQEALRPVSVIIYRDHRMKDNKIW